MEKHTRHYLREPARKDELLRFVEQIDRHMKPNKKNRKITRQGEQKDKQERVRRTVDNLTQRAFVSRNTFYLHYTDKYEMLDKLVDKVLHGLSEFALEAPIGESAPMISRFVLRVISYINENQEIFLLLSGQNGDMKFYKKLQDAIRPVITQREFIARLQIPHDTSEFAAESILRWWKTVGRETFKEATKLYITCDCGGSNGYRTRLWE